MSNQLPYEKLFGELREEFRSVEESLQTLQRLHKNLPLSESVKRNFADALLKQKSAWYACLVNPNIDVLLIPEYLESKQSRNILIKRETDQYFKSLENFDILFGKNPLELYECILHSDQAPQSAGGFDLFSSQVVESTKCPEHLAKALMSWNGKFEAYGQLASIVFELLEWHKFNQFSFASNRQIVLWLNYKFKQEFGHISLQFNHENYFFNHWNKESRDMKTSVKELLMNWKKEAEAIKKQLKQLYRNNIGYDSLKSTQKLVANHLFENDFDIHYPMGIQMSQYPALKPLLKRGFVELSDFGPRESFEKYQQLLDELLQANFILPVREDEIFICINPSFKAMKGRLAAYANVDYKPIQPSWSEFTEQTITVTKPIQAEEPKQEETTAVMETGFVVPDLKPLRKKAFFG